MEIVSIFEVIDFKTKLEWREEIQGFGQTPIRYLRTQYPKLSHFVLLGFEINGRFIPLDLRNYSR